MKFWDSSAIVPLLLNQERTAFATRMRHDDPTMAVWWGTVVECASAIARLLRQRAVQRAAAARAFERLVAIGSEWLVIEPSTALRDDACRLLRAHPLRSADSLQLAAAIRLADELGERLAIVCFDQRLADAARSEQLVVIDSEKDLT